MLTGSVRIRADLAELCVTEWQIDRARNAWVEVLHRQLTESFYVLDGELASLLAAEEQRVGRGGCACVPAGMAHGFRSASETRFLSLITPAGGFAKRATTSPVDDDPVADGSGGPPAVVHADEGERRHGREWTATIKIAREELSLVELTAGPGYMGPAPHIHDDHVDCFYVLDGEAELQLGDESFSGGAGSFLAAPPGVVHTFSCRSDSSRLLNVHAPSAGFVEWLRENSMKPSPGHS